MTEQNRKTLQGRIKLDGKTFRETDFLNAELVFEGGLAPTFINCTFSTSRFAFQGAAGNTVQFLRAMLPASTNMRHVVLGLMPEYQQG